ncbi:very low-density lipoprotein receptor-like [Arapaima gigas]
MGRFGTIGFLYLVSWRCILAQDCRGGGHKGACPLCSEDSFRCTQSGTCVPGEKRCDGTPDCPDGMDELVDMCSSPQPAPHPCPSYEFTCRSGQCILHSWRCDHSVDCSDGSDEEDCDQNECLEGNGGCSHLCIDQPMGFVCDCPSGMRLVRDTQCEEIDECLDVDLCSQMCVLVNGSITCECQAGYKKLPQTGVCRAEAESGLVALSSLDGMWKFDMAGSEQKLLTNRKLGSGPLAAFIAKRTLYWADSQMGTIYEISLDGSSQDPVLLLADLGAVLGLAVDWLHEHLYWTDAHTGSISVATLSGSATRLLVSGVSKPAAVAVEPALGFLFWADSGSSPRIERANLDGQERVALVTSAIHNPVAISLDIPRNLLYWVDSGLRTISRVGLDGYYRKTVLESNGYLDRPFGLVVFEDQVVWSDEETHSVCSVEKHNGTSFQVLLSNIRSPGGMVVVHSVLQPKGMSPKLMHTEAFCTEAALKVSIYSFFIPGRNSSHPVEAAASHDIIFAGVLSLIVFLSMTLAGITLWWWRTEFSPFSTITLQTNMSLKESHEPLVPVVVFEAKTLKDTLLKMDEVSS